MGDLIRRESLKQRINLNYNSHQHIDIQSIKDIINTEPSVEDETVEELEKLKAEFEEDKYILLNQTTAIKVIDNHIKELKGETE